MPSLDSLTLRAHAKINLALAVGPPQPPRGYHPIASWFACVGLHDELALSRLAAGSSQWSLEWAADAPRPSPIDWPIEKDLAVRAHRLVELTVGRELPLRAELTKRTPVGAGLGGGSSDAAAALVGINELFSLGLARAKLRELSTALGSDIAFFIDDSPIGQPARPAIVTGFGETIERIERRQGWVALVFPPYGCPTGPVYQAFDRGAPDRLRETEVRALASAPEINLSRAALFNDLAVPACDVEPRLGELLAKLRDSLGTAVHVTGSGSTLFVPASSEAHARQLAADARRLSAETATLATPLL